MIEVVIVMGTGRNLSDFDLSGTEPDVKNWSDSVSDTFPFFGSMFRIIAEPIVKRRDAIKPGKFCVLLMFHADAGSQSPFFGGYFRNERGCILIPPYVENVPSGVTMLERRRLNIDGGRHRAQFPFEHESFTVPVDSPTELRQSKFWEFV